MRRHLRLPMVMLALVLAPLAARAQSVPEHIAMGDREHSAVRSEAALRHYEAALAVDPTNYEALWKAARSEVDLGEAEPDKDRRDAHFRNAELLARRAVAARPGDAEGHFHLARALGRAALAKGPRDRVKYGAEVRAHALEALKLDPKHPGALHVMGMWNAEIMRLNGFTRFVARNFLGGKVFDSASWKEAVRYMEEAVAIDPTRLIHRLDLAEIYSDIGEKAKARAQLEQLLKLPDTDPGDPKYRRQAEERLRKL